VSFPAPPGGIANPVGIYANIKIVRLPHAIGALAAEAYMRKINRILYMIGLDVRNKLAMKMASLYSSMEKVNQYKSYWDMTVSGTILTIELKSDKSHIYHQEVGMRPWVLAHLRGRKLPFVKVNNKWIFAGPNTEYAGYKSGKITDIEEAVGQTDVGKVLFRTVTQKSIEEQSWLTHGDWKAYPEQEDREWGIRPKPFFLDTVKEALQTSVAAHTKQLKGIRFRFES